VSELTQLRSHTTEPDLAHRHHSRSRNLRNAGVRSTADLQHQLLDFTKRSRANNNIPNPLITSNSLSTPLYTLIYSYVITYATLHNVPDLNLSPRSGTIHPCNCMDTITVSTTRVSTIKGDSCQHMELVLISLYPCRLASCTLLQQSQVTSTLQIDLA
jgi:hypothetical protein